MLIQEGLTLEQKLAILSDAAKYDVACTSSGIDRRGQSGSIGNTSACGICHCFAADGRCISLLKILMTNACIYDCRYCINRVSNDTVRTTFTPEEICRLTIEFYRRNYIEGLFLSSGILNSPDETMEQICRTLWILREEYHFRGYIHVKAIPGADPELIACAGHLADRMSINLELPTGDGLRALAPAKSRKKILTPMRQIQNGITADRAAARERKKLKGARQAVFPEALRDASPAGSAYRTLSSDSDTKPISAANGPSRKYPSSPVSSDGIADAEEVIPPRAPAPADVGSGILPLSGSHLAGSRFVPAGQSTQMIIGATPETDRQILAVTEALYDRFDLKRVFYSAYTAINDDSRLPAIGTPPPLLREHRLYQADWLLRFYGFRAEELLPEDHPFFNTALDPKCSWAIRHPEIFPVEIMSADYHTLLRVPGLGVRSARRILTARRYQHLTFEDLKKFGVVLKRAGYFLTCSGRMYRPLRFDPAYLETELAAGERADCRALSGSAGPTGRQMSLFDDFHLS